MSATTHATKKESSATNQNAPAALAVEKRTRRACVESMTVHPHGGGSGMFDVYNVEGKRYVVDLRDGVCECPDYVHREPSGGCKHQRRVRLEFGIMDGPHSIRNEHTAPTDVELARKRRGIGIEPEPETESIKIEDTEASAREAVLATDGGWVEECPHGRPDCEGVESHRERPVLCWDCWSVWADHSRQNVPRRYQQEPDPKRIDTKRELEVFRHHCRRGGRPQRKTVVKMGDKHNEFVRH